MIFIPGTLVYLSGLLSCTQNVYDLSGMRENMVHYHATDKVTTLWRDRNVYIIIIIIIIFMFLDPRYQ